MKFVIKSSLFFLSLALSCVHLHGQSVDVRDLPAFNDLKSEVKSYVETRINYKSFRDAFWARLEAPITRTELTFDENGRVTMQTKTEYAADTTVNRHDGYTYENGIANYHYSVLDGETNEGDIILEETNEGSLFKFFNKDELYYKVFLQVDANDEVIYAVDENLSTGEKYVEKYEYEYDSEGRDIKEVWYEDGEYVGYVETTYLGNREEQTFYNADDSFDFKLVFLNDDDERVISKENVREDGSSSKEFFTYDDFGNVINIKEVSADGEEKQTVIKYTYDERNNWVEQRIDEDGEIQDYYSREITYY